MLPPAPAGGELRASLPEGGVPLRWEHCVRCAEQRLARVWAGVLPCQDGFLAEPARPKLVAGHASAFVQALSFEEQPRQGDVGSRYL